MDRGFWGASPWPKPFVFQWCSSPSMAPLWPLVVLIVEVRVSLPFMWVASDDSEVCVEWEELPSKLSFEWCELTDCGTCPLTLMSMLGIPSS